MSLHVTPDPEKKLTVCLVGIFLHERYVQKCHRRGFTFIDFINDSKNVLKTDRMVHDFC